MEYILIIYSSFPGTTPDREGIRQFIKVIRDAFPDIKLKIEDLIAEGDKVVEKVMATGTNTGTFMGINPTGKQIKIPVILTSCERGENHAAHTSL